MKLYNIFVSAVVMAAAGALSSCTPGQYWNDPGQSETVYAFPKGAESFSIDAEEAFPEYYDVMVTRSNADGEVTVPVTFEANSTVLNGPASVTFPAGSTTANYRISISPQADILTDYTATITMQEPENPLVHLTEQNTVFSFTFKRTLVLQWTDAGTAQVISSWVGNEEPIEVPVQECTNWPISKGRVIRLVDMYYAMEPAYATPGASIAMLLDANYNAAGMYSAWQYIGEESDGAYFFLGIPASYDCSFTNEGDVYTIDGFIAYGSSPTATSLSPYNYETVVFQWSH